MDKIELFKEFVKKNPNLLTFVKNGKMTWQSFYEMYDLYGEQNEIWSEYLNTKKTIDNKSVYDTFSFLKSINLDSVQEGVQNIQRVLGVLGDISNNKEINKEYKPRPLYKHFDD